MQEQILLVGDSGVGKSSLLMRFTADQFEDSSAPTIGVCSNSYLQTSCVALVVVCSLALLLVR